MRLGLRWRRRPRRCRRHAHTSLRVQSVRDRRGAWSTAARSCASCWDRSSGELASSRRRLHSSSGATMHWRRPRELWRRSAAQCSITLIGKVNQESGYCPMQCSGARRVRAHAARTSNQAHTHMRGAPNALTACPCLAFAAGSPACAFGARSRHLGPTEQGCTFAARSATAAAGRGRRRASGH